jgi:hypothetical protein
MVKKGGMPLTTAIKMMILKMPNSQVKKRKLDKDYQINSKNQLHLFLQEKLTLGQVENLDNTRKLKMQHQLKKKILN